MKSIFIVVLTFLVFRICAQDSATFKMSDFIGINTDVSAYDQRYIDDLSRVVKWIREYHSWAHYEVADNYYRWDNFTKTPYNYSWPDHNKFMDECQRLGINVLIDVLHKPAWAGEKYVGYSTGDGTNANDYLDKLEFIGQLVARYGAQKVNSSLLETADKVSGLNYIKYYEDDNEPDYWWWTPKWSAEKYAVYCNAVHDGFGVETSEDYPLLGIKSVDSSAVHVLAGLAATNSTYIQKILNESNGRVPFDVLNIHTYCKDNTDGYSPENEIYGLEKNMGDFMEWRNKTLPDIPIWLTEFGWDTYISNGSHSYIYAPHQQQANYILRSYFIALKMGFEKAFLFMAADPNSDGILQYSSSGIITDQNSGLAKKPSYYYLATMQNVLGNAVLNNIVSYKELTNNNEIYCFEFLNENNEKIYAAWTREKNSKTDNGATANYSLELDYQPKYAHVIAPKDKNYDGEKNEIELTGNSISLELTETPQFIVVSNIPTNSEAIKKKETDFKVFPNPAQNNAQIVLQNNKNQNIEISVFSSSGKKVSVIENRFLFEGQHRFSFGENIKRGVYFVQLKSNNLSRIQKVIFQ